MKAESSAAVAAITMSSINTKDSRRRQYRSCDRCRTGKRACNAVYDSVAEAITNKVACSNCRKKGKTCSFQYVLSILGGVPTTSAHDELVGEAFAMLPPPSLSNSTHDYTDALGTHAQLLPPTTAATPFPHASLDPTTPLRSTLAPSSPQWQLSPSQHAQSQHPLPDQSLVQALALAAAALKKFPAISPTSPVHRITAAVDRKFLNDGLIRVYEGAAEQALQCWITSSNTPYMLLDSSASPTFSANVSTAGQQLVYWRICELDRGARSLLGNSANRFGAEKDIMDAFHSVVLAFAAQWSPQWISGLSGTLHSDGTARPLSRTSENKVRLALWKCARDKLQKVANLDSFRVIFALIIFAWTEKPREVLDRAADDPDIDLNSENCALDTSAWQSPAEGSTFLLVAAMRKLLSIKFKIESKKRRGLSPWNAPRDKIRTSATGPALTQDAANLARAASHDRTSSGPLRASDPSVGTSETQRMAHQIQSDLESRGLPSDAQALNRAQTAASPSESARMDGTYHMLYWLCVVIDTETSVLRKHPPVVCDEDSEVMSSVPGAATFLVGMDESDLSSPASGRRGIWDDYILDISKRKSITEFASSWPCDEKRAAATLAFSTPVKVVMFRQISRLQMSFWRRASTVSVEQHIRSGLSIIYHWNQFYGRLIDSCRESHASLPASIQSWYVLIAFPWYLAVLLFVEMVQTVDMAGSSDKQARSERARSGIFPRLRDRACSDLALLIGAIQASSFDHVEPTFQYVRDSGGNLLLTEPWSEILVHSITTVVKTEIKLHEGYCSLFKWKELEESRGRIEKCLWALEQLSDRSPSAQMAHEQLEKQTNARRQGHLAFQQIPMASPPLQRQSGAARHTDGPSPGSDVDSNGASCFGGSVDERDASIVGFGKNLPGEACSLESAFQSYFASNVDTLHQTSGLQADVEQPLVQFGAAPIQPDYLQMLQMIEQTGSAGGAPAGAAVIGSVSGSLLGMQAGADQLPIDPLSILETLAELCNQPVRDPLPLSSNSSSSSVETAFSLDSADWGLNLGPTTSAGEIDSSAGDASFRSGGLRSAPPYSTGTTSVTSCSDSDEESSSSGRAKKRSKLLHLEPSAVVAVSRASPPSHSPYQALLAKAPTSVTSSSLAYQFVSVPLQAATPREHDDLYGDDDDDELVSYRNELKRKQDNRDGECQTQIENALRSTCQGSMKGSCAAAAESASLAATEA